MESDLIKRSELRETLEMRKMTELYPEWRTLSLGMKEKILRLAGAFRKAIDSAPAIDAVPMAHEHWIDVCRGKVCICSRCGQEFDHTYDAIKDEWLFCPKCGAKMDAEEGLDAD